MRAMHFPQALRLFFWTLLALLAAAISPLAQAQDDPPGRVGRIADLGGGVSWFDAEQGQWTPAERNRPLTGGDRISTARDGRAELRIGSTTLRLANATELEVLLLDDARIAVQLHSGSLALRVRAREVAGEIELITDEARLLPLRAGLYRVDRKADGTQDSTQAGTWRGELRVDGPQGLVVAAGQRVDLLRSDRPGALPVWGSLPNDGFAAWVTAEEAAADAGDARTVATRYVSPEMTGAEDLDRNGRWEQHPDYGAVWTPLQVQPDWAPYRHGRWTWVQPWGWTWVDDAPWGFAPFHYGRWAFWRERWCWVPGAYVPRPVFAPALVGWVGGGGGGDGRGAGGGAGWSLSVRVGGPPVGWVPLAPREVYQPAYRSTPVYLQRVNPPPPYHWQHPPGQRPAGPVFFMNQDVRNGITVVPPDVLARRQPVARALINAGADWRGRGGDVRPPEGPRGERPGMVGPRPMPMPPQPQLRVETRPAQPVPQAIETTPRPLPERQVPWPRRGDRMGHDERERERERPQRDGGRMVQPQPQPPAATPAPTPAPAPAPALPAQPPPANRTPPAALTPSPPPPQQQQPPQRQMERPREPREPRDRPDGEQRGRRADGPGPGRERDGNR